MSVVPGRFALSLGGPLSLRTITDHRASLLSALTANPSVSLDIAEDAQIDLSFLQLVEAARIYAATSGRQIALAKPASGTLHDLLERSGFLQDMLPDDANFWLHQGDIQ
jgi:hypothetical protein